MMTNKGSAFRMSLKRKLILSFTAILLFPCLTIGWFSYQNSKEKVDQHIMVAAQENVNYFNRLINDYMEPIRRDVDYLAQSLPNKLESSNHTETTVKSLIAKFQSLHSELDATYVGTSDGKMVLNPEVAMPDGYDPRKRPWYENAIKAKGLTIMTDPYVNATNGEIVVTFARANEDGSKVIAVDLNMTKFAAEVMKVKIGKHGYLSIIDKSNAYLVHPSLKPGTPVPVELVSFIGEDQRVTFSSKQEDQAMRSVVEKNDLTGWRVMGTLSLQEINDEAAVVLRTTLYVILVAMIIGVAIIYFIIRSIIVPVRKLIQVSQQISEGDLTVQVVETLATDEIAQLGRSFNKMIHSLRTILMEVSETSSLLAASSEELTASSEQTSNATQFIAENIEQMAEGAEVQVGSVKMGSRIVIEMSKDVRGIAARSQAVSEKAVQATRISKEGNRTIQTAVSQMNSIQGTVENLSLVIKNLTSQSNEIGNIVSLISKISAQTNLLSLNASIEAARAGEHGRGFSVVAQEVKKLSEQTADSSKQITSMIKTIQTETQQAVVSMDETFSEVTGGIQIMNKAGELFSQIQLSIEDVEKQIQEVSIASKQVLNGVDQAAQAMGTISDIVEESALATHNVSSAVEEQLASMEEIAASSEALSKMAIELQEMNEKFKM